MRINIGPIQASLLPQKCSECWSQVVGAHSKLSETATIELKCRFLECLNRNPPISIIVSGMLEHERKEIVCQMHGIWFHATHLTFTVGACVHMVNAKTPDRWSPA